MNEFISKLANDAFLLHDSNKTEYKRLLEYAMKNASHTEYCKGGLDFHRGYLCPSPIIEYIVTNLSGRGRKVKNAPQNGVYHVFYYDNKNQLNAVEFFNGAEHRLELLVYQNDKEYGFTYNLAGELVAVSVVEFENKLPKSYVYCQQLLKERFDVNFEGYSYNNGELSEVVVNFSGDYTVGKSVSFIGKYSYYSVKPLNKGYALDLIKEESGGGDLFDILKEDERVSGISFFESDQELSDFVKMINDKFGAE